MIEHAIFSILSNDAGVSAIAGNRIYPILLPQNVTYPCVSYSVDEGQEDVTFDGQGTFQSVSIEIDSWSTTHAGMLSLSGACKAALKNYSGTVSGITIDKIQIDSAISVYEDAAEVYRKTLLITVIRR